VTMTILVAGVYDGNRSMKFSCGMGEKGHLTPFP